jgi:hypothetical protein
MSAFFGVKCVVSFHGNHVYGHLGLLDLWICLQTARLALRKQFLAVAIARERAFGI